MKPPTLKVILLVIAGGFYLPSVASAQFLDQDGVSLLRTTTTNLNGTGIRVAQPEDAGDSQIAGGWVVDPAQVGQPVNRFTYASYAGTANVYPNALGTNSPHGVNVAQKFYGIPYGIATNVAHVDNFESGFFYNNYVSGQIALNDSVVSQSYTFGLLPVVTQQQYDTAFDNYAAKFKTLFVSAVDNGDGIHAPATCYNGIGVAAYGTVYSSIGPTADNGRCKPDICAPDYVTSFATPQVTGVAAVLLQAALRGDGGSDTNSATDIRTLKALLLNGAVKPAGWTNSSSSPLDARYGAGLVNAFNSYRQLIGGKQGYIVSNLVTSGSAHLPAATNGTISVLNGWDFNTNTSSSLITARDGVNHYYFNATNSSSRYLCNATLVWNRQLNQTNINHLGLFLYNCADSNLVASSVSPVDNVEHLFVPQLAPGRYDLQVWKSGSTGTVSNTEAYALAFQFTAPKLALARAGTDVILNWPVYPAGLTLVASTNLASAAGWSADALPGVTLTNGQNVVRVNAANNAMFFRLNQP